MDAFNKLQLKRLLDELKNYRSRHTELVSIYVPADFNIEIVKGQIMQEVSTASNIKSKTTRKNVLDALDKGLTELRYYKVTPPNGLVVLAGNISDNPAVSDLRAWSFEPPEKISVRIYQCEQTFILDPLFDMTEPKNVYGLIVIDEKDLVLGVLRGKKIQLLKEDDSVVPGKTRKGGQSAQRFQRVRKEIVKDWFRHSARMCRDILAAYPKLKGILVGGSGPAKDEFIDEGELGVLKDKIITVQDIGHTGIVALEELVSKSSEVLANEEVIAEKNIVNSFLEHLGKNDGLASYGVSNVRDKLSNGLVKLLLVSEKLEMSVIDELMKIAQSFGTETVMVSTDTREGEQLMQLGGVGAILRYKVSDA